jgi:diguanylate cyclase (GGDEF)-like protein
MLRERIGGISNPGCRLALVRIVEGISLAEWQRTAAEFDERNWLALPLDTADGLPLQALQDSLEELVFQRDHDMLTGLVNRRPFDKRLRTEVERASRAGTDLSLVMLDIDNFKAVNDTYGHPVGDQVLVRLSGLLSRLVRSYDTAARIGGEEFCLILPGASTWRAQNLAKRILNAFRAELFTSATGQSFSATFSAGTASLAGGGGTADGAELLARADKALYQAKREGKNRVIVFGAGRPVAENRTLVRSAEKKFLVSGGK